MKNEDSASLAAGHPLASQSMSDAASHAELLDWQIARYGDSVETRLALAFYRARGWRVDDREWSREVDGRIYAFISGYRAAQKG